MLTSFAMQAHSHYIANLCNLSHKEKRLFSLSSDIGTTLLRPCFYLTCTLLLLNSYIAHTLLPHCFYFTILHFTYIRINVSTSDVNMSA